MSTHHHSAWVAILLFAATISCKQPSHDAPAPSSDSLALTLRTRDSANQVKTAQVTLKSSETAIIVVDMWDEHWCRSFTGKSAGMIDGLNETLDAARKLGIQVIFAPSDIAAYYKDYPQHQKVEGLPAHELKVVREFNPPFAPWSNTGGCECNKDRPCVDHQAWTRQHEGLRIEDQDVITAEGQQIHNFCQEKGIKNLLYTGVASNICVTKVRSFSVIPMTRYGYNCVVVRDRTEAITGRGYDPDKKQFDPALTPELGSQLVIEHIERSMVPTVSSDQLTRQAGMPE